MAWFRGWLDQVAPAGRQVILVGFSGGAAFAGGLLLAGVPVFVAHGETDTVIPRELLDRTWSYLLGESGAPAYARRDPGGHVLTDTTVAELGGWIAERLQFLAFRSIPPSGPNTWSALPDGTLPARSGARPDVSWSIPQEQRSDNSPRQIQEQLLSRITALPGVTTGQSAISVPGARGFMVERGPGAPMDAFLVPQAGEFAHLHRGYDGSLHLALPPAPARDAITKGWAVAHPLAGIRLPRGTVMIYGPRNTAELDIVTGIIQTSYAYASETLPPSEKTP
jgi:phospholipase/carboxylesterase